MSYLDSSDAQEELEIEMAERFPKRHRFGKIIKISLLCFVAIVNIIILWRVIFSDDIPSKIEPLYPTDTLRAAYAEHGDDLILQYQKHQLTLSYDKGSEGYFGVPQYVFIPQANQVQVVFRYNNSTIKNLATDYNLSEIPSKSDTLFDVTLLKVTDLTPDHADDQNDPNTLEKVRYKPDYVKRDTTSLYTYYRFVFEGVTIDESAISSVFLDVYYIDDVNYSKSPYGTLRLYDHLHEWTTYELTSADKRALKN